MTCLTVRNPWALALFLGKDVENRDWLTAYRGPLAIHSSAGMGQSEFDNAVVYMSRVCLFDFPFSFEETKALNGMVLGTARLIGCVKDSPSLWFQGKYGFVIEDAVRFDAPIPAKGALGFWNWESRS